MMLENQPTPEDMTVEVPGIKVYVDRQSTSLLSGFGDRLTSSTLMGAGLRSNNPNAVSGCGCGSSFRTAESAGSREAAATEAATSVQLDGGANHAAVLIPHASVALDQPLPVPRPMESGAHRSHRSRWTRRADGR